MSIYSRATLGEPDNQIVFNDYTINPVYRSQSRMPQKYQLREEDVPVPFHSGISDFLTLIGETVYIIQGVMYPADEASYDSGLAALRTVSSLDFQQTDPFAVDEGYVPYIWGDASGNLTKQIFMKVLYCMAKEDTQQGFVQPFQLVCKIKDPTIYGGTLKTASTAQANPTTSTGAAVYSFTYPIVYGSQLFTVSANANNIGSISSYPQSITIYGPVTTPTITNTKTGEYIKVNVTLNSTSDQLIIQYSLDSLAVTLNGVNQVKNVATGSTYFQVHPGINTIQLSGASVGTGAYAVMNFYDSYPLA